MDAARNKQPERIKVLSRCLGEIFGYIPACGEFYSSINRSGAAGIIVRSRRAGYTWNEYSEGMSRRLLELIGHVRGGEYETGHIEFAGRHCRWDVEGGIYVTDTDGFGNAGEFYHKDIFGAVCALYSGGDALMRRRIEKFEAGARRV